MYGVPADLDLSKFLHQELDVLGLAQRSLHFQFENGQVLSVEGRWKLVDPSGRTLDESLEHGSSVANHGEMRLQNLLGQTVTATKTHPPHSISLHFDRGHELRIFDSSENFESFHIYPDEIHI
jgi:hypothetical protein